MLDNSSTPRAGKDKKQEPSSFNEKLILDTIIECSQDTIYFKDLNSRFIFVSLAQALRLNLSNPSEAIGKTDFDFFPEEHAKKAFEDEQWIIKTSTPVLNKIEELTWPTGETSWVSASKYPLYDHNGKIIGTWGISRDITAQRLTEEELERVNAQLKEANKNLELLSSIDSLSGLFNQRCFYETIQEVFNEYKSNREKGQSCTLSICIFDIDLFKNINDSYGHLTGDNIIRHIGSLLKKHIRCTDTAYRYGGDEFIILFHDTDLNTAAKIVEALRKSIMSTGFPHNGSDVHITISAGVSSLDEAADINDLIEKADRRLYFSKENGRNRVTSNKKT